MFLLLCFFAFLHCWLNLFGELLRFADRMFYKVRVIVKRVWMRYFVGMIVFCPDGKTSD